MIDPSEFGDPGPLAPTPPRRLRRAFSVAVVVMLIAAMVFLAWVSGRGAIVITPVPPSTPAPTFSIAGR